MSRGRINPVDLELERAKGMPPNGAHVDADADYVANARKFERHDDMAAEPTRSKAGEPGRK
jgi:hypothetical protein